MSMIADAYKRAKSLLPTPVRARLARVKGLLRGVMRNSISLLRAAMRNSINLLIHRARIARMYATTWDVLAPGIGRRASGCEVVMLVYSDLRIDPRVERETRTLARAGYHITVVCPIPSDCVEAPPLDWGPNVSFHLLPRSAWRDIVGRPGFEGFKMFKAALRLAMQVRPFAIHAHDLNTCLVGWALAHQTGAHLLADFHEWTSENVHWDAGVNGYRTYPDAWKKQLQDLEQSMMKHASAVITVCDSIADALKDELGGETRPTVVRNIPIFSINPTRNYPDLKTQFGLSPDSFVVLYQGGTGPTRLLEPIIQALEFAPRCTLIVRGPSLEHFGESYKVLAEKAGAASRLILAGPVPSKDVVAAARGADAGIWSLPAFCRNFTYALPNKVFEYMTAGLPVLAADYPEVRRLTDSFEVGLTFDPYDPQSIAHAINRMAEDPAMRQRFADNTWAALASLDANAEWLKVVDLYEALPRA